MIEVDDFKAFDANEVAEMLDLKYRTVTRYIQAGKIRARKIGKKYFVTERDVKAFIWPKPQMSNLVKKREIRPIQTTSRVKYEKINDKDYRSSVLSASQARYLRLPAVGVNDTNSGVS